MAEERTEDDIDHMLRGEFLHHLSGALGIGCVVLDDQLDGPAANATHVVDHLDGGDTGALIPIAIGGADAGAMRLEADLERIVGKSR